MYIALIHEGEKEISKKKLAHPVMKLTSEIA